MVISQTFIWATICGITCIFCWTGAVYYCNKNFYPYFMAFSLKFGDKRSFFHAVKNRTMGCYQTFVTTYFKMNWPNVSEYPNSLESVSDAIRVIFAPTLSYIFVIFLARFPTISIHLYSARQVSGTINWRGTTLITFDMEVTCVIFDRNSVV